MPFPFHAPELLAVLTLLAWMTLFFAWGGFWQVWEWDADRAEAIKEPTAWPAVTAVIPARNEAGTIAEVVAALAKQEYPGALSIFVVDDHSEDETAKLAHDAALQAPEQFPVAVISAPPLAPGWTGKLWALNAGVRRAEATPAEFLWFTDADVLHHARTLRRLVARAEQNSLDLASLMVLLKAKSFAERLLIPPFLYFFLMLYPPKWIANSRARTAGAAGGCILLRRAALARMGGLSAIRGELIDDCALAHAVKRSGGTTWMGLTRASRSLRSYKRFGEIRDMIARTAFTQLRYSPFLLFGTLLGMLFTFVLPVALTLSPERRVWPFALAAWCLMTASFLPTVAFYRLSPVWAPCLPISAMFYAFATWLSALRHWLGRGGQWKGRAQGNRASPGSVA